MVIYLFYFSVFAIAVLVVGGLGSTFLADRARKSAIERRMQLLEAQANRFEKLVDIRLERGLTGDGRLGDAFVWLRRIYLQSGLRVGLSRILIWGALFGVVIGAGLKIWLGSTVIAAGFGVVAAALGPLFFVLRARQRRIDEFARQLPDAIDVIVRSLRAGHPVPTALGLVATDMRDPIASEFGILTDELTYGTDMDTALGNLIARTAVEDLSMLAMTVAIQRQTGGNLAEILDSLSATIRERFILRMRVRSLTAEGRFSAVFMTLFPGGLYLMLRVIAPGYFDPLWEKPWANYFVAGCLLMILVGNYVMRRMVNFRI